MRRLLATLGGLALLVLAPGTVAAATTYYLDNTRGSDRNDGLTSATAWASLDRVNRLLCQPGDRLLIRAGTRYQGQLRPRGSGGAVAGGSLGAVVIDRYGPGDRPRIAGAGMTRATLELRNLEYFEVNNLELTNQGPAPMPRRTGVLLTLNDFGTAHRVRLRNLSIHDVNGSNVKKEGGGAGIAIEVSGRNHPSRYDDLLIENCHLVRCDRNGITGGGMSSRRNWLPSLHVVIRGNLLEDIGGDGIVPIGCDGALVERNVLRDCGSRYPPGDAAAGIWPWSCDNTVIQFNEVSGQRGWIDAQGYDSDWNCRGTLIQYNYSHNNEGGFLLVCNKGAVPPSDNVGNVGTIVRYNLSVNDGWRATGRLAGSSPTIQINGPCRMTRIYNNTIYIGKKNSDAIDHTVVRLGNWGGSPTDTVFRNNIFYAEEWLDFFQGRSTLTVFERNLTFGELHHPPIDPRALHADPLFVRQGAHENGLEAVRAYRLRPGSPATGAGLVIPDNGGRDLPGTPLPADRLPSIGACEAAAH